AGPNRRRPLLREGGLHDDAVLRHRFELACLGEVELLVLRQILDGRDALFEIGSGLLRADAREVTDVVRGVGPAAAHERALVRLEAVQADWEGRERAREHRALPGE